MSAWYGRKKYLEMGHVVVHYGDQRSVAFEEWFLPRFGRQRRVEVLVDSFSMVSQVLLGTDRIATLHRRQADYFARHLPVRLIDMPFDLPQLVQLMAWPSHLDADPAHAWLRSLVTAVVADLPPLWRAGSTGTEGTGRALPGLQLAEPPSAGAPTRRADLPAK
jgi:LysR family nod box-dependent transcriptional activator